MPRLVGKIVLSVLVPAGLAAGESPFPPRQVVSSAHFIVRHESPYAPAGVMNTLEFLHARLMLDLQSFSPWANREPVEVYLYKDAASYRRGTGMPEWAGAHVEVARRRVYAFEGEGFQRSLAHELGHLFFMSYFQMAGPSPSTGAAPTGHFSLAQSEGGGGRLSEPPLWLNEGVATLMEWEYGGAQEDHALQAGLREGPLFSLPDLFRYRYRHQNTQGSGEVSRWYGQSSSVVKFLMRRFSRAQFAAFCEAVRSGKTVDQALPLAYGPQIPDVPALERLWKRQLEEEQGPF